MMRVNLGKKLVFYSKHSLQQNENQINKLSNICLTNNVFKLSGMTLVSKNRFFHSNLVNQMMSSMAQQSAQTSTQQNHQQHLDREEKDKKQQHHKKLDLFTVKQSATHLIHYDSVVIDRLCEIFSSIYINRSSKNLESTHQRYLKTKDQPKTDVENLDQYWMGYFQQYVQKQFPQKYNESENTQQSQLQISGHQIIQKNEQEIIDKIYIEVENYRRQKKQKFLQFSQNLAKRFILDQNDLKIEAKRVFESIKNIFKFLDKANIGFLRGDLHSQTVFKINRYIQRLQNNDKSNLIGANFSIDDYKRLFDNVTEFNMFRLPKRGIKNYELQSKNNLYQRQLNVETVSSQQSFDKFHGAIQSLSNVHKVHLTGAAKKYIIEWLPLMIDSIKDEQMKCKIKDLDQKRILYAPYIVKINPEKIATVILSELVSQIMQVIFIGGDNQCIQANQYYSISWRKLCRKVSSVLNAQFLYEQEEKKFKSIQKLYDYIMNYELKKSSFSADDLSQPELDKLNKLCEHQINLKDLEIFMKNLKIFDVEKPLKPAQTQQKTQGMVKKLQIRTFLQKKLEYRYVKPQERKQFLNEVINRITKRNGPRRLTSGQIPEHIQLQLGAILVSIMKNTISVKNRHDQKAYLLVEEKRIIKDQEGMKTVILLKINEDFLATIVPKLQKEGDLFLHQERSVATIVPPLPWVEPEVGGYYLQATNFMRFSECKVQQRLVKHADLKRLFGVLNYLGSIPWKINTKVLAVVEEIWNEGGNQGQVPKRYSQLVTKYTNKLKVERTPKKISEIKKVIQQLRDQYSDKCSFVFKLNTARAFSRVKYFYFPHNIDFRGRVYPVPPHLNHIGNDLSRGLLLLGKGQRLGESGLKWLKIHCANLMGKDKATIPQKLAFIEDNMDLIYAIGKDPLKNREWIKNEDCWQSLGAILQLYDALTSPSPVDFISHLHVHQDGSCNGLQHYAALGRDMEGAYQVNLGVTDRPGDVYTHVAKMVIKMLDEAIGDPNDANRELALKLKDNIKRKTIKQTVMTSVYGVTFIGARQQIHRQLKDQNFLTEDESYKASVYVATLTLRAISNLFTGAHHIKKWLISCAKLIGEYNCPVGWVTPMGLPVVQPYRTLSKLDAISTVSQLLKVPTNNEMLPINKNKQKSAFPPNFVHSLDSTHMLYTAEQCNKRNISFAAVHDSYWTHAGKVQEMNEILRDQFIKLHSQPILENLKKSFEKRFPQINFPDIPERGSFDLENVRKSIFFFS